MYVCHIRLQRDQVVGVIFQGSYSDSLGFLPALLDKELYRWSVKCACYPIRMSLKLENSSTMCTILNKNALLLSWVKTYFLSKVWLKYSLKSWFCDWNKTPHWWRVTSWKFYRCIKFQRHTPIGTWKSLQSIMVQQKSYSFGLDWVKIFRWHLKLI